MDETIHWTVYRSEGFQQRECDEAAGEILDETENMVTTAIGKMSWEIEPVTCNECKDKIEEEIDLVAVLGND